MLCEQCGAPNRAQATTCARCKAELPTSEGQRPSRGEDWRDLAEAARLPVPSADEAPTVLEILPSVRPSFAPDATAPSSVQLSQPTSISTPHEPGWSTSAFEASSLPSEPFAPSSSPGVSERISADIAEAISMLPDRPLYPEDSTKRRERLAYAHPAGRDLDSQFGLAPEMQNPAFGLDTHLPQTLDPSTELAGDLDAEAEFEVERLLNDRADLEGESEPRAAAHVPAQAASGPDLVLQGPDQHAAAFDAESISSVGDGPKFPTGTDFHCDPDLKSGPSLGSDASFAAQAQPRQEPKIGSAAVNAASNSKKAANTKRRATASKTAPVATPAQPGVKASTEAPTEATLSTTATEHGELCLAGAARRFAAALIDGALLTALIFGVGKLGMFGAAWTKIDFLEPEFVGLALWKGRLIAPILLWLLAYLLFSVLAPTLLQESPGKRILGLRLVSTQTGERLTIGQRISRAFLGLLGMALGFASYAWLVVDRRGRTLHDWLSRSAVVRAR